MESSIPFFSIVTICLNSEKTIEKTIQSVLNQSFDDYEYIIIDGKSTDKTVAIIEKYLPMFNGKMKYISEKDNGIYFAMNKGIEIANGTYIGLINSDDWYEPHTLYTIYTTSKKHVPADIYYGLMHFYKQGSFFKTEGVHHSFLDESPLFHPTCFISKETYTSIGDYSTEYRYASDYEYFYRCRAADKSFVFIDTVLANFSLDGITTKNKLNSLKETYKIQHRYKLFSHPILFLKIARLYINNTFTRLINLVR